MVPRLSLAARAFLFGFVPICVVLGAIFFTINATVRNQVKSGLQRSMRQTEQALDMATVDYNRRTSELLGAATEDSGLKASIGLLREAPYGDKPDSEVLKILDAQLREVARGLDYDLLILADVDGNPITGYVGKTQAERVPLPPAGVDLSLFPLMMIHGAPYEGTAVPINLGTENIGSLILGKKFDIAPLSRGGYAALIHDHKILLGNVPAPLQGSMENEIRDRCPEAADDCEIHLAGQDYLAARMQRTRFGNPIQLFTLQSLDASVDQFMGGFRRVFLLIGSAGILLLLVLSAVGSRSLSKPLTNLIAHLNQSERSGRLRAHFSVQSPVKEVNRLAEAFNSAAEHLERTTLEFVETMAQALDARDPYTAGHSNRVSVNSTAIAAAMGLSPEQIDVIRIGAQLHDIGKIGVPDAVLQKPGKLTADEYALIQLHPLIGKKILEKSGQFQEYLPIVELHHENSDGSGYPYGLKQDAVPVGVRIVHVADVYDAITSHRAYRRAMSDEQALKIMREGSGTQFDSAVLEAFLDLLSQRKGLQEILEQTNVAHLQS